MEKTPRTSKRLGEVGGEQKVLSKYISNRWKRGKEQCKIISWNERLGA